MTREEHISNLETIGCDGWTVSTDAYKSLQFAIQALEQEPCEDCISRAEAIDALGYDISIESDEGLDAYRTVIKEMLVKIYDTQKENIEKLPSIQPKAKTGHWIVVKTAYGKRLKCDKCEHYTDIGLDSKYCANCGAKMLDKSFYASERYENLAREQEFIDNGRIGGQ